MRFMKVTRADGDVDPVGDCFGKDVFPDPVR